MVDPRNQSERRASRRHGRVPAGLLGMVALAVAVELFLARHPLAFGLPDWGEWSRSGRAARERAPGCDVLCFGDSMMKDGLQPRVIVARLGRPAYNLAVSATPPPASYFLLRRALASGARPAAVVVGFSPSLLADHPRTAPLWGQLLDAREAFELAWDCREPSVFVRAALDRYIPSVGGRHVIRTNVRAALLGLPDTRRDFCEGMWRNWDRNLGAAALFVVPQYRGEVDERFRNFQTPRWSPSRVQREYVRRFFALAASHGIPAFWVIPPTVPALESRRSQLGLTAAYDRFARRVLAEFPGVTVLDGRRSGYGPGAFADAAHLNRRGASALSADVADAIGRRLASATASPRWVALPPFADRPDDPRLEDFHQSMTALKEARILR
jgi:hypothetical protein